MCSRLCFCLYNSYSPPPLREYETVTVVKAVACAAPWGHPLPRSLPFFEYKQASLGPRRERLTQNPRLCLRSAWGRGEVVVGNFVWAELFPSWWMKSSKKNIQVDRDTNTWAARPGDLMFTALYTRSRRVNALHSLIIHSFIHSFTESSRWSHHCKTHSVPSKVEEVTQQQLQDERLNKCLGYETS